MAIKGQENLITFADRSEEEKREISLKGAKASAEARRKKKLLKESLELLLEMNNNQENICVALVNKALDGDVKAFETIRDSIGQKCSDKVDIQSSNIVIDFGEIKGD